MNHNKGLNYGEVYGMTPDEPAATHFLECLKCDSKNVFLVWPRETERTDVNIPARPRESPPPLKSREVDPLTLKELTLAAGTSVVHYAATPVAVCRACGLRWEFGWWQCPPLKQIRERLWAESKESLAVINALKSFVFMPENEADVDGNHLYTKYYNMLTRHRFGAAIPPIQHDNVTPQPEPTAAKKLPASRKRPNKSAVSKKD